ncbi:hypothetical protein LEN26_003867 [Aphanomyces euteiches]|nr:hypothetical protein AeMF1_005425 [Aphanomyces euteiches]KAH9151425.1 hypothetical protein LEN26_003867 [Aphanomyces euteiches]
MQRQSIAPPISTISLAPKMSLTDFQDDFQRLATEELSATSLARACEFGTNFMNQEFAGKGPNPHGMDMFMLENFGAIPPALRPEEFKAIAKNNAL